jgi:hypothetical protein
MYNRLKLSKHVISCLCPTCHTHSVLFFSASGYQTTTTSISSKPIFFTSSSAVLHSARPTEICYVCLCRCWFFVTQFRIILRQKITLLNIMARRMSYEIVSSITLMFPLLFLNASKQSFFPARPVPSIVDLPVFGWKMDPIKNE